MNNQTSKEVAAKQAADGLSPELKAAALIAAVRPYSTLGEAPIIEEIRRQIEAARGGDLSRAQAMLVAQAETLDVLFYSYLSKANTAKDVGATAAWLCLAVKASEGCGVAVGKLQSRGSAEAIVALTQ